VVVPRAARLALGDAQEGYRLATDEQAMARRELITSLVLNVRSISSAFNAAEKLTDLADQDAQAVSDLKDEQERQELLALLGIREGERVSPSLRAQVRRLEEQQKRRAKRVSSDTLLRSVARVLGVRSGVVELDGRALTTMNQKELARRLGLLAQSSTAPADILVEDLVARGRYPHQSILRQWSAEDDEAVVWACADVLREEYKRITDAGLTVQIDAPDIAEGWDQMNPEPSVEDYRAFSRVRIDALNHALEGIDPSLVRFHVCWGSWHGPHTTDIPFKDIVDLALLVNANGLTFEAANARHAHEWTIWRDIELPEGKYLIPGVVSHSTNVVEHPELVAQRIRQFADIVGDERVVASTDCGLGGRIYPSIAWAKLEALAEGARLASK